MVAAIRYALLLSLPTETKPQAAGLARAWSLSVFFRIELSRVAGIPNCVFRATIASDALRRVRCAQYDLRFARRCTVRKRGGEPDRRAFLGERRLCLEQRE